MGGTVYGVLSDMFQRRKIISLSEERRSCSEVFFFLSCNLLFLVPQSSFGLWSMDPFVSATIL